ncbi:MAG: hypothetical protein KAW09_08225, partial [Thermoplasmata archaeon]|nr:hypothetical protein [Thermoplasmata archaeon]
MKIVGESVWARAVTIVVTMAMIVPLTMIDHIALSDGNESPLFSEPSEPTGDLDYPYVFVEKVVQPSTIYKANAPPGADPRSATVTLRISG